MKFLFHPDARLELDEAINYYETRQIGLGFEFAEEVYSTIQRIMAFPEARARLSKNTRRCLTNRFPCGIIYQSKPDYIRILAIMQLNREPGYWKNKI